MMSVPAIIGPGGVTLPPPPPLPAGALVSVTVMVRLDNGSPVADVSVTVTLMDVAITAPTGMMMVEVPGVLPVARVLPVGVMVTSSPRQPGYSSRPRWSVSYPHRLQRPRSRTS
ncbi:hypothetical protein P2W49_05755 [Yersinia intermedia]|nr:hypothetical protein P2W49_05755 [Yersinia intermedia]